MSNWIKITDRRPTSKDATDDHKEILAVFQGKPIACHWNSVCMEHSAITHWMPLPSAPVEPAVPVVLKPVSPKVMEVVQKMQEESVEPVTAPLSTSTTGHSITLPPAPEGYRWLDKSEKKDQWITGAKYWEPKAKDWRFAMCSWRVDNGAYAFPHDWIVVPVSEPSSETLPSLGDWVKVPENYASLSAQKQTNLYEKETVSKPVWTPPPVLPLGRLWTWPSWEVTEENLPVVEDGGNPYRPLMRCEKIELDDEVIYYKEWVRVGDISDAFPATRFRTRRSVESAQFATLGELYPGVFDDDADEPTTPTGIEASVCVDIALRQKAGITKYGTTVRDNPLPIQQWLQHAYEEALDLAIYLKRAIEELKVEGGVK